MSLNPFKPRKSKNERQTNGILFKSRYMARRALVEIRKIEAILRNTPDDKMAADLQDLLLQNWNASQKEAIRDAIRSLKSGTTFTQADLDKMNGELQRILGPGFYSKVEEGVKQIDMAAYGYGLTGSARVTPTFNLIDKKAIAFLDEFNLYWVREHYDRQLRDDVTRLGKQVLNEGMTKRQAGDLFAAELGKQFENESWRYWQGFANQAVTRSREFGAIENYVRAGVEKHQVKAVIDHRTTEICRKMHNRILSVSKAVNQRDRMMEAQAKGTPEDVLKVAAWMKPEAVAEKPSKNISLAGMFPPYHYGNCRTRTVAYFEEESVVDGRVSGSNMAGAKELQAYSDDEYSEWIKQIQGSRLGYDDNLVNRHLNRHKGEFSSVTSKKEYIDAGMDIVKNADRVVAKIYRHQKGPRKEQLQFVFFSQQGQAVVGDDAMFHGIFGHSQPGDSTKAFEGQRKHGLWLKLKKNS